MDLKRQSLSLLVLFAATALVGSANDANASLFCGRNCQARKAIRAAQATGQPVDVNGVQVYGPQASQQQQGYYQQPQVYQPQTYQPQTYQPQTYQPQISYQSGYGYSNYDYRSKYVQLTNTDWTQFASAYGSTPTPLMGAAYDKTAYPISVNEPDIQTVIKDAISQNQDANVGAATVNGALANKFYALRGYQPAFITAPGPNTQAVIARDLFTSKVVMKGLDPRDYWSKDMEDRFTSAKTPFQKAGLDLLMVQSLIHLASDLSNGRSDPKNIDSNFMIKKRTFTDFQALNNSVRPDVDLLSVIASFEPQHADYQRLLSVLPQLYEIKARGGYVKLAGTQILKMGVSSPDVFVLRQRLMDMNILPNYTPNTSPVFEIGLADGVKQFQFDNKLKADGILGRQGVAILNATVDYRIMEVRATLEKWRFMPRTLGNRYILVNIARQEMQVMENGRVVMAMKTVNGKPLRPTNILIDKIINVALNPYWNPPVSLIIADIQEEQRKDPKHMATARVKIFQGKQEIDPATVPWNQYVSRAAPYRFEEQPGTTNSLGVVKFQTTNNSAIYMHDTNHREFFDDFDERFLSSGCIRLQKPLDLLQYLLRSKPDGNIQSLNDVLSQPTVYPNKIIDLGTDEIPFYVFYGTASFDDTGKLRFARDAYGLDDRIVRAATPMDDEN